MIDTFANATMEIPVGWVLTSIGGLAGIVTTLAGSLYATLKASISGLQKQIEDQDEVIEGQGKIIEGLQGDVKRMSKGCGVENCTWRHRE